MNKLKLAGWLLVFVVLLSACSGSTPAPAEQTTSLESAKRIAAAPVESSTNQGLSLEEIQNLLYDLLPRGQAAVELAFGYTLEAEIPPDAPAVEDGADYYPVKQDQQTTIDEMKKALDEVFTPQVAREYYWLCFAGTDPLYKEEEGELFYNRNRQGITLGPRWHVDTAVLMRQTVDEIMVEMDTTSFDSEPVKEKLYLKKIDGSWYLDTQTLRPLE